MKKLLAAGLALTMSLSLTACMGGTANSSSAASSGSESSSAAASSGSDGVYNIGICQQMQHVSLDEATQGFEDALTELLGEGNVKFDYQNAGGEQANCTSIVSKFVTDNVDLIMANATTAVQCAKEATTEIPVVGTSVTDYVSTGIVDSAENPGSNVTGYSDLSDANNHVELIQQLLPEAKTVAILYSTGEENSRIQAESAAAFEAAGLTAESYTANDSNDISSVVTEACTQADVIYVPTDNLMAANMELVKNVALNQKVPVVSCFTADENDGALLSISISYYTMGYLAGEMAYEILVNGADPASMPIGVMSVEDMDITINQSVADELGITIPESMQQYVK